MNKLVASTLENKVHLWDLREQHPREGFAHHAYAHDRFIDFSVFLILGRQKLNVVRLPVLCVCRHTLDTGDWQIYRMFAL